MHKKYTHPNCYTLKMTESERTFVIPHLQLNKMFLNYIFSSRWQVEFDLVLKLPLLQLYIIQKRQTQSEREKYGKYLLCICYSAPGCSFMYSIYYYYYYIYSVQIIVPIEYKWRERENYNKNSSTTTNLV